MHDEVAALTEALRALAKKHWPLRKHNVNAMEFDDQVLLLGVYLDRKKIDKLPARHAEGSESGPTAKPSRKT